MPKGERDALVSLVPRAKRSSSHANKLPRHERWYKSGAVRE